MKVIHAFAYVFAIFAFLTFGSLMIIVSMHTLTMTDAILKVQDIYDSPWKTLQMGITGLVFMIVGIVFAKILIKQTRQSNDVILYGKWGHVNVSIRAINEVVRKGIRKFEAVQAMKVKTEAEVNQLRIKANISVLSGANLSELVHAIQAEISSKIQKMLGEEIEIIFNINVVKVIGESGKPEHVQKQK